MLPKDIIWRDVLQKIMFQRQPLDEHNFLQYNSDTIDTKVNLSINGIKYGTIYAIDDSYCALKSVIELLNKKDPLIGNFKTSLYHQHKDGLIPLVQFQNFMDSYGIKEAIPILTKQEFDKGFDNHRTFHKHCIIMIDSGSDEQQYKHLIAYRASGKSYIKLHEMLFQQEQTQQTDKLVPTPQYFRKSKSKPFSGTKKDFYVMLRQAHKLMKQRHASGLLTDKIDAQTLIILGQISLHKSFIYQYIDFQKEFSQIVYSQLCVMLNRKSDLVVQIPSKTVNIPKRYVQNVTVGEKKRNAKILSQQIIVGTWTKDEKNLFKSFKQFFISRIYGNRDIDLQLPVVNISQPALLSVQPQNIAAIYAPYNIPVQNLAKKEDNSDYKHWTNVPGHGIVPNPQPGVTKQCTQAIQKAGLYVHSKSTQQNTARGGGHSNIRFCADSMMAVSLSYIAQAKQPIVLIDVGAKYSAMLGILHKMYAAKTPQQRTNSRCRYIPVRPNYDDYDQVYHEQNLRNYNNYVHGEDVAQVNGRSAITHDPVLLTYIQRVNWDLVFYDYNMEDVKIFVLMNDCHYYFNGTFSLPFNHTLLLSGMNYTPYVGRYYLPFSEGYFQIDKNRDHTGQITMFPQSSSRKYTHAYTFIDKVDREIDFGWISFIQKVQFIRKDQYYDIYTPNVVDVGFNIQNDYFHNYYLSLNSNVDLVKAQIARWPAQKSKTHVAIKYNTGKHVIHQNKPSKLKIMRGIAYIDEKFTQLLRFIFQRQLQSPDYQQRAYIHLPQAGTMKTPTVDNPDAQIHDNVEYSERSKKTMVGCVDRKGFQKLHQEHGLEPSQEIKVGYVDPETFISLYHANGSQPHEVPYNELPKVTKPQEVKIDLKRVKQQDDQTCFVTKDFPVSIILDSQSINPLIKVPGQDAQYDYNCQQCKIQYYEAECVKQKATVIATGIRHLQMTQDDDLVTVEFATTSIHNQIFAMYGRCYKSQQRFSIEHLDAFKLLTQDFIGWFKDQLSQQRAEHFDPIQWIHEKDDFSFEKKQKYQKTILKQLKGHKSSFVFSYRSMLKSGEEFKIPEEDLYLPKVQVDNKPRDIKVPAAQGCGLFTAMQSQFWEPIKNIYPGFIQGYLPQELKQLFNDNIAKYDSVISDDGSAFEATQFFDLQEIVDIPIMRVLLEWFKEQNIDNGKFSDLWNNITIDQLVNIICPNKNLVFVKIPNEGKPWDDITRQWWDRDWKQCSGPAEENYDKYLPYWIRGTKFSGVPQTTLTNTFCKLMYSFYDIFVATGKRAWLTDDFFVAAAGDDGITMGNNDTGELTRVQEVKLRLSDPDVLVRGLGQCIKEAPLTESWNFDFCSKLVLRDHGVFMGRDLCKTLTQKQYFTKKNLAFAIYPHLHVQAIRDGLVAEKSSRLLEDILLVRYEKVKVDMQTNFTMPVKKNYHSLTTDTGYEFEDIYQISLCISKAVKLSILDHSKDYVMINTRICNQDVLNSINKQQLVNTIKMIRQTKTNRRQMKSNRRQQQQQKAKEKQEVNKRPNTVSQVNIHQSQNKKKQQATVFNSNKDRNQQMQVRYNNNPAMDYVKSILNPFNTDAIRAPSDFHLPTSILNHRYEMDHTFGATYGVACLLPQHFGGQGSTNAPSWFNVQSTHSTQTTAAILGGEGILTGECPLAGYHSEDPTSGGQTAESKRFTSARLLRVGIKIYPTANLTVRSGTLVIAQVPGKTFYHNTNSIRVPTVQQLKQYPTSITVNLSTIDQSGQSYVWLPLDVDDTIFQSPDNGRKGWDNQAAMQYFRNPIWACFEGISAQDSYRFEVYSSYEYVPTMIFESWANVSVTKTPNGAYNALKKILDNDIFKAVAGIVGEELTHSKYATGMLKPAFDTFMSIV